MPTSLSSSDALRQLFHHDLERIVDEEEVSLDRAFLRLCVDYLGFDRETGVISDGKGDYGIDFIETDNSGASIIQSKSIDFDDRIDFRRKVGQHYINDLPRIRSLFENLDGLPPQMNPHVKRSLMDLRHHLHSLSESQRREPFHVTVHLCVQAAGFTDTASTEFERLNKTPIVYGDVEIVFTYHPVFLNDLLAAKWNQANTQWRNRKNQKREAFVLDVRNINPGFIQILCLFYQGVATRRRVYGDWLPTV